MHFGKLLTFLLVSLLLTRSLPTVSQTEQTQTGNEIEYLVFKGGGVLGMAYAGAIEELESHDLLPGIKGVAGTSAGAVTALVVALNYDSKDITALTDGTQFKDFEDKLNPLRVTTRYGLYEGAFLLTWIEGIPQ